MNTGVSAITKQKTRGKVAVILYNMLLLAKNISPKQFFSIVERLAGEDYLDIKSELELYYEIIDNRLHIKKEKIVAYIKKNENECMMYIDDAIQDKANRMFDIVKSDLGDKKIQQIMCNEKGDLAIICTDSIMVYHTVGENGDISRYEFKNVFRQKIDTK